MPVKPASVAEIQQVLIRTLRQELPSRVARLSRKQKARASLKYAVALERKLKAFLNKAKPAQAERLQENLKKVKQYQQRQRAILSKAVIRATDQIQSFAEKPWRELTKQEKRVSFEFLRATFNNAAVGIKKELSAVVSEELARNLSRLRKRLEDGDINALVDLTLVNRNKVFTVIVKYMKEAFEAGKKTASEEINVDRPPTPLEATQLMNLDADILAEKFVTDIDVAAKRTAMAGYAKGQKIGYQSPIKLATGTIMVDVSTEVEKESADAIVGIVVTITGTYVNKGRSAVFERHENKIQYYQRSEILDDRTCPFCEEMDQRIFNSNDPLTEEDLFHENCRGIWVPILDGEDYDEEMVGIPKGLAKEAQTQYDLPKPTTEWSKIPLEGPGAAYKPPSPEFRPPSEIVKDVPIENIEYRVAANAEEAQEDVKLGRLSKTKGPILVAKKKNGLYEILDGAHRLEAARLAGEKAIDIRVIDPEVARTQGTDVYNKLMRPPLAAPELKAYNSLSPDAKHLYDRLRIEGEIPHSKALKEAKDLTGWKNYASVRDPLGNFPSNAGPLNDRKRENIIVDAILNRYKKP